MTDVGPLPIAQTVGDAYGALFRNFGTFFVIVAAWSALVFATFVAAIAAGPHLADTLPAIRTWPDEAAGALLMTPTIALALLGVASLIVAWHRLIIQEAEPTSPFPTGLGAAVVYGFWLVAVFALPMLPLLLFGFAAASALNLSVDSDATKAVSVIAIFVGAFAVTLVIMRLSLVLPATAVGDRSMTRARAWALTRGNSWRLFWGAFLCAVPFNFVENIVDRVLTAGGDEIWTSGPGLTVFAVGVASALMGYVVAAGFISHAYLHFTGERQLTSDALRVSQEM